MLASVGACVVLAASDVAMLSLTAQPAAADPLADAKAQAEQLTTQIQAEGQHLEVLSQQYDADQQQVQQLAAKTSQVQEQIGGTRQQVTAAQSELRHTALRTYMDGSDTSLDGLFGGGGTRSVLTHEYSSVAAGNTSNEINTLHRVQDTLSSQEAQLQSTQVQAQAAAAQVDAARQSALAAQQQQQQTLSQVKGQIATLVAQQQAAEQRAQAQAFQARLAATPATPAAPAPSSPDVGTTASSAPVAGGGSAAVQAAESQLGVPYVWGGEQPGRGFDCSGLTEWSWRQAGVSIPRTAQEQYDAIAHISLSDLQPGDLLFWNDGTNSVQHVAMYVGHDEVIQAPQTGETVSYSSIWNDGLVGAGRP